MAAKVDITFDAALFRNRLAEKYRRNMPFATALALTRTAQKVKRRLEDVMRSVFDRPTSFTINSLRVIPATKARLTAIVKFKDDGIRSRVEEYLSPQIFGGKRKFKRFEGALNAKGVIPKGMIAVPGAGAKLDANGNMSRGQIVQILSALGAAESTAGYSANRTANSIKRRKGKLIQIFVGRPGNGHAPLGVWQRKGRQVTPLLIFVRAPSYTKRFPFYEAGIEEARRIFPDELRQALRQALSTDRG